MSDPRLWNAGGFSPPPSPPRAQAHLWQDTAGWHSLLLSSPVGRLSHRPPNVVALVGDDVATLTPQNPKPGAPPPRPGAQGLGGGSIPFRASAGIRGASSAPQPSASGPEASAHPPAPGWSMEQPLGPHITTPGSGAELRHPAPPAAAFCVCFRFIRANRLAPGIQNFLFTRHFTRILPLTPHILLDTFYGVRE